MNTYGSMHGWQVQVARGSVRIGDRERDDAAEALGDHFAAGRLSREEYDDRLALVFGARTWADLTPIFGDLPGPKPGQQAPPVQQFTREAWLASRRRRRLPMFPILLILIGAAILTGNGWVFWLGLGGVLLFKKMQWHSHRSHSNGNWRTPRGTWA